MTSKAYEVHLEVFEGPLDLLLHLIKKNDLEISNIPLAQITKEYLAYLELMKELNLDVAGDFLVMASTLMQIKARSLLPAQETSPEEGPDPRTELVQKLVEYQKFKQAAHFLDDRSEKFGDIFFRGVPQFAERDKSLNIRIFDLLSTLREVLDRTEIEGGVVAAEEYRIEDKIEKIVKMLENKAYILLRDIFVGEKTRRSVITCFMALLELIKTQRAFARQEAPFAEILIYEKKEPVVPVWPGGRSQEQADAVGASVGEHAAPERSERGKELSGDGAEGVVGTGEVSNEGAVGASVGEHAAPERSERGEESVAEPIIEEAPVESAPVVEEAPVAETPSVEDAPTPDTSVGEWEANAEKLDTSPAGWSASSEVPIATEALAPKFAQELSQESASLHEDATRNAEEDSSWEAADAEQTESLINKNLDDSSGEA